MPLTLLIIFMLLFFNSGSAIEAAMVMLAVPFSLIGAFWLLWLLGYNMSVAVWVGLIALAGLDAETGIVMLLYLDLAWKERKPSTRDEAREAVVQGAVKRIRPKMMTVATILVGLVPILWSQGTGADVMKRIAAPMVGGVVTSAILLDRLRHGLQARIGVLVPLVAVLDVLRQVLLAKELLLRRLLRLGAPDRRLVYAQDCAPRLGR